MTGTGDILPKGLHRLMRPLSALKSSSICPSYLYHTLQNLYSVNVKPIHHLVHTS